MSFKNIAERLLARQELPPLAPKTPYDRSISTEIAALPPSVPPSIRAGLFMLNDDIHNAHETAQSDEGNSASDYWHSIVHRREGDYWNSKWWINRISNPVMIEIHKTKSQAGKYVDEVEKAVTGKNVSASRIKELEQSQWEELKLLMNQVLAT